MTAVEQLRFAVGERGEVSALLCPADEGATAPGAGSWSRGRMSHPFIGKLSDELASVQVATLRYQFSYMEERRAGSRPAGRADGDPSWGQYVSSGDLLMALHAIRVRGTTWSV